MTLQALLDQGLLQGMDLVSIEQVKKRFESALNYLAIAQKIFKEKRETDVLNHVIYTNLYSSIRLMGEVFLLLHGYKATINQHHKTVIQATKILMNDHGMEEIFSRLDRMRKNRNSLDYDLDILDVSDEAIKQAIKDAQRLSEKIQEHIDRQDKQKKLKFER